MLSFQPFGLRSPTGHCRLDGGAGEGTEVQLELDKAGDLKQFQREEHRRAAKERHVLAATGRDRLHVTDLRRTPDTGFVTACARLTGFHQWLTVSAHRTEVQVLGTGAGRVSSLWLAAVVAMREQVMAGDRPQWLWLLGLDDSQRVQLTPDGRVYVDEVPTGINRLIDLVQKEMELHFRASAFDLLFNEEFDWDDAPPAILREFLGPLQAVTETLAADHPLAVVGLGPRLGGLSASIARKVGMAPWTPPGELSPARPPVSFETWLLREAAAREVDGLQLTAAFAGAPLFLPAPGEAFGGVDGTSNPPFPTGDASAASGDAATANEDHAAPSTSGRRRSRRLRPGGWLRHHPRRPRPRRTDEGVMRKVVFVVVWVLVVTLAGHLLVEQGTEHAREHQGGGGY